MYTNGDISIANSCSVNKAIQAKILKFLMTEQTWFKISAEKTDNCAMTHKNSKGKTFLPV